jgi:hypothetical protein
MNKDSSIKLSKEFITKLKKEQKTMSVSRSSTYTQEKSTEVLDKIQTDLKVKDRLEALTIIAVLFHLGGTARKCDGNLSVELFGRKTKLAEIRRNLRECGVAKSERKLARSFATEIRNICLELEIPGNLCSKIQKSDPDLEIFSIEEATWLSDFQVENPDCPAELRKLIGNLFSSKTSSKPNNPSSKANAK